MPNAGLYERRLATAQWVGNEALNKRDLLATAAAAGVGGVHKVEGDAHLQVDFNNLPAGTSTYLKYGGLFKSGKVDWGYPMAASDPGGK
jgi:hypothetical protein